MQSTFARRVPPHAAQRSGRATAVEPDGTARVDEALGHRFERVPVGGARLPAPIESRLSSFFGRDLSDVRVHEGPEADALDAQAFTRGSHIYFAPGRYRPSTPTGRALLGHELAHVEQQRGGVRAPGVLDDPALERSAHAFGAGAARALASEHPIAPVPLAPAGGLQTSETVQCVKNFTDHFPGLRLHPYSKGKTGYVIVEINSSAHATIFTEEDLTSGQRSRAADDRNTVTDVQKMNAGVPLTFTGFHISFVGASEEGKNIGYHYTDDGNIDTAMGKKSMAAVFETDERQQALANDYAAMIYRRWLGLVVTAEHLNGQSSIANKGLKPRMVVAKTVEEHEKALKQKEAAAAAAYERARAHPTEPFDMFGGGDEAMPESKQATSSSSTATTKRKSSSSGSFAPPSTSSSSSSSSYVPPSSSSSALAPPSVSVSTSSSSSSPPTATTHAPPAPVALRPIVAAVATLEASPIGANLTFIELSRINEARAMAARRLLISYDQLLAGMADHTNRDQGFLRQVVRSFLA
jgi:hypothetical protein